jgi:hypothetical protein
MCLAGQSDSLLSIIEDMQRLAAESELERVRPDVPCKLCTIESACYWHRLPKKGERK